jgi:hypothetical protein
MIKNNRRRNLARFLGNLLYRGGLVSKLSFITDVSPLSTDIRNWTRG